MKAGDKLDDRKKGEGKKDGGQNAEAKKGGGKKNGRGPTFAVNAEGGVKAEAEVHADAHAEWKRKVGSETVDTRSQDFHMGEINVSGNTDAMYVPRGEKLYSILLKLGALKHARLEVYC